MKRAKLVMLLAALAMLAGCVERKLVIRSEPGGADVFVNEVYRGTTNADGQLELDFAFYGSREIRVGPIRDVQRNEDGEIVSDSLLYHEMTRVVELERPWFQKFPADFFAEVLWPETFQDYHYPDEFRLESAAQPENLTDEERAQQAQELRERGQEVLRRASDYRDEALRPDAGMGLDR